MNRKMILWACLGVGMLMPLCGLAQNTELHYFVVDRSGSIAHKGLTKPISEAVYEYMDSLGEASELRIVFFNDKASSGKSWSPMNFSNKTAFMADFKKQFRPGGNTRLYDTVAEVLTEIIKISHNYAGIKVMILSDGEDTKSAKYKDWPVIEDMAGTLKQDNKNSFIIWYTIGFKPQPENMPKTESIIVTNIVGPIVLGLPPVADFEVHPTTLKIGETVKMFVLPSPGDINEVAWDFGDGATDNKMRTEHTYNALGKYTVTLKVANQVGENIKVKADLIEVIPTVPVSAIFSWAPMKPRVGEVVQLVDKSEGQPKEYEWDFGPYGKSTDKAPAFTPTKAGRVQIGLKVRRDLEQAEATEEIDILPQPPTGEFSLLPGRELEKGQVLKMDATEKGEQLKHEWTIEDWSATGVTAEWTADKVGMVEVWHQASGPGGVAVQKQSVSVTSPPPMSCDFTITPPQVQVGDEVTIVAAEKSGKHIWTVAGKPYSGASFTYATTNVGIHEVVHEIPGEQGGHLTKTFMVIESLLPEAKIGPTEGNYPLEIECRDVSKGVVVGREWDFGDGTTPVKDLNPVRHTYTNAGKFKVNLTIRNAAGQRSSLAKPVLITIKVPPIPPPPWRKWAIMGAILLAIVIITAWILRPRRIVGTLSWESQGRFINQDISGYRYSICTKSSPSGDTMIEVIEGKPDIQEQEGRCPLAMLSRHRDDAIIMQDGVEIERWPACEPRTFRVGSVEVKYIP